MITKIAKLQKGLIAWGDFHQSNGDLYHPHPQFHAKTRLAPFHPRLRAQFPRMLALAGKKRRPALHTGIPGIG